MKKISLSIATAAVLAMTAVAGAAELSTYEKAGLPVSAVQLQVLGAERSGSHAGRHIDHARSAQRPHTATQDHDRTRPHRNRRLRHSLSTVA